MIYDYQPDYQNLIEKKIKSCFHEKYMHLSIDKYTKIMDLMIGLEKKSYEFAFIDMRVHHHKGIEIAKYIRQMNPQCEFIFMSNKYLRIPETFQLHALEYILKPIDTNIFHNVFEYMINEYKKKNIKFGIPMRSMNSHKKIFSVDDIRYIQTYYNDIKIVTTNNNEYIAHVKTRYKLREALKPRWFIQINESVLVNMKEIEDMTEKEVILKNHEVFQMSSKMIIESGKRYTKFKQQQKKYGENNEDSNM